MTLWSTYWTARSTWTRSTPILSNCMHASHRTRGVLEKCLIYPQPHLLAGAELPFDHVILEDPGDQILRQSPSPRLPELACVFYILILRPLPADTLTSA